MLGRVLNTHQQWLCRQLADRGYVVSRQVAVDDCGPAITGAVEESLGRAELILVTGGLGPTSDDRTRDLIAGLLARSLREDPSVLAHIETFFSGRGRPMPASTCVQALVPEGATVLPNAHGTAPGLVLDTPSPTGSTRPGLLVMLPGPPRELRPMFLEQAAPLILKRFPREVPFVCRTLKTTGVGESVVEERIARPLQHLVAAGLEIGYCARSGEVDVRFVANGLQAQPMVTEAEEITRSLLRDSIYGIDDEDLATVVVRLLTERKQSVALAESCTGGFIAHRLTNVPGASAVFAAGLLTYSNEAKQTFLGVRAETLAANGAVSEAVAREMVKGVGKKTGADYALSVTGIAGPGGGSVEKPVGTVFLALASGRKTIVLKQFNPFDRETFKQVTSQQALNLLRRKILDLD